MWFWHIPNSDASFRSVAKLKWYSPCPALAKSLRREGADVGLFLDMAAPNLGEWLAWADSWDVPTCPTYEVLAPTARLSEQLVKAALKAAREKGGSSG